MGKSQELYSDDMLSITERKWGERFKKQWVQEKKISHLTDYREKETFAARMDPQMMAEGAEAGQKTSAPERAKQGQISMKDILAVHSIFRPTTLVMTNVK